MYEYAFAAPRRHRRRGMMLIELMVVVAIIFIIAALLIPRYMDVTDTARRAQCNGNIATMNSAASVYLADHLEIATTLADLVPDYLDRIPDCPFGVAYLFDGYSITNVDAHLHPTI